MNLKLISKGAQAQDVTVSDTTFAREYNESLVHQIIVAYMAAGRAGTKAQKTKAEQVAKSVEGVTSVKNLLKVSTGNDNKNANANSNAKRGNTNR